MLIRRQSVLTKLWHTMELPVTQAQVDTWRKSGKLIQDVFPTLTPSQRDFLITGATDAEWDEAFGDEDDIDLDDVVKVAIAKTTGTRGPND